MKLEIVEPEIVLNWQAIGVPKLAVRRQKRKQVTYNDIVVVVVVVVIIIVWFWRHITLGRAVSCLIPMAHALEIGAENRLHFSGAD